MTTLDPPPPRPGDPVDDDGAEVLQADGAPAPPELAEAPPVVAVVVAHDPGPWFEEALTGLGDQDYPNLSVLVLDAASAEPVTPRVAAVLPKAFVRRLEENPGFGATANAVLELVDGAAFLLLCHDDVCPDPGAVRLLVEEAFRSNAGVVGPKVVSWDAPASLLQVGQSADKTGVPAPLNERDELDQEQHDGVRDVFLIPGAATLVRADLFAALGGFDPAITYLGEDLDLCWRAQVAGARVVVAPDARVRHREALPARRPIDDRRRLQARHRLRTLLTCYGPFHLLRVLPWAAGLTLVEAAYALVTGHVDQARDVAGAWSWNLRRLGEVRARRRLVRRSRRLPDAEVRRLQVRGSARFSAYLRGELGRSAQVRSLAGIGRDLTGSLAEGRRRPALVVLAVLVVVLAVGSRDLVSGPLPAVGSVVPLGGVGDLLGAWASGHRSTGLGAIGPAPTGLGLLGLGGALLLGRTGALQLLLVVGMLPVGLLGAWRLTRPLGLVRARLAGVVAYASVPVAYDALAGGAWATLLLYGASPWLLHLLLAAGDDEPFAGRRRGWRRVAPLAALVAALTAFVPLLAALVVVVAGALGLGALVTGRRAGGPLAAALGAVVVAAVVHLPWSAALAAGTWWGLGGVAPLDAAPVAVADLLRFGSATAEPSLLHWSPFVAAALPLLIGQAWRFGVAAQVWAVALTCWALADLAGRDVGGLALPPPSLLVVPGAAALSLGVALGVVAFAEDLRGFRFGWRQVASLVAAGAVAAGTLPALVGALDGRWGAPAVDFAGTLDFTRADEVATAGGHRTLWIGAADVLPAGAQPLADDLAYAVTDVGVPAAADRWSPLDDGAGGLAAEAVRLAADGGTDRLGRLLAPLGIRYLALPSSVAPERAGAPLRPLPAGLLATAERQLDLRPVDVDLRLALFENAAWAPVRAAVDGDVGAALAAADASPSAVAGLDLTGATPVLPPDGRSRYTGVVDAGDVYVAEAGGGRWQLEVDGEPAERRDAVGFASTFSVDEGGQAELRLATSPLALLLAAGQALLWLALGAAVLAARRSGRDGDEAAAG